MTAVTEGRPILKLKWKTETPVWVDQWLLSNEKIAQINDLVSEQLQLGHIQPSTSPWNTPIFTIPKKSGKWCLLHDLRKVNEVMENMGTLQPGLPSPNMIPQEWDVLVIDLKDCFFTIPLHEDDYEKFAFSVPSVNKQEPTKRYHWVVLPQGMKNSPTMCQLYVAWALAPLHDKHRELIIYHYMDDILITGKSLQIVLIVTELEKELGTRGLKIAPEKIQQTQPWKYLGWEITKATVHLQKLTIRTNIQTLNDVQKIMGDLNWIRTCCGITNDDLLPIAKLLQGGGGVDAPRSEVQALVNIMQKISKHYTYRWDPEQELGIMIINNSAHPFALIMQWAKESDPLRILEWLFLSTQPKRSVVTRIEAFAQLIIKGRSRIVETSGKEPDYVVISLSAEYLQWALQNSIALQSAMLDYSGPIRVHYPPHKLMGWLPTFQIE